MTVRAVPILAAPDLDVLETFYLALGFRRTYRQQRPNPYLAMVREGLDLHFAGVPALDPETSLGSVLLLTEDTHALFEAFAAGLRAEYGRLPITGTPRITRPRVKQGIGGGFTVVDPGGNWLRVTATRPEPESPPGLFDRVLQNAARQGDARGDVPAAIGVLEAGLRRHPDAAPADLLPVLEYLAELLVRSGDQARATTVHDRIRSLAGARDAGG
ncbi:hypothetical protein GIS00_17495 [Nakamurella sp. YIM 132087]|uniref:VOC family protein n=1 Tax=Nakamurella alba TaxID=2665158 RepID=A0A7K1FNI9_9ACTN|nr:hypothetical protein [Nakamurella alba]MTD15731.1 hypothetical protein [Nakamurella alba]